MVACCSLRRVSSLYMHLAREHHLADSNIECSLTRCQHDCRDFTSWQPCHGVPSSAMPLSVASLTTGFTLTLVVCVAACACARTFSMVPQKYPRQYMCMCIHVSLHNAYTHPTHVIQALSQYHCVCDAAVSATPARSCCPFVGMC